MAVSVKVDGEYKPLLNCKVKVNGDWKQAAEILVKKNGVWKAGWQNAIKLSFRDGTPAYTIPVDAQLSYGDVLRLKNVSLTAFNANGEVIAVSVDDELDVSSSSTYNYYLYNGNTLYAVLKITISLSGYITFACTLYNFTYLAEFEYNSVEKI